MSTSRKTVFRSKVNRMCSITYNKTDGIGHLQIKSVFEKDREQKYDFVSVFDGDMHFYKGNFESVGGKDIFVNVLEVSSKMVNGDGTFLPEKRYSINVLYTDTEGDKTVNFGFYRRYRGREKESTLVVCNFIQTNGDHTIITPVSEEQI